MRGAMRLVDPKDDTEVWWDLSPYIDNKRPPEFPPPPKTVVTSENFSVPGATVGGVHYGLRPIRLHLVLFADSQPELRALWRGILGALEAGAALEFAPDDDDTLWFDLIPSSITPNYDPGDWGSGALLVTLELQAQPFGRGSLVTAVTDVSVDNSPNNTIVLPEVLGDVEAPAEVQIDAGAVTPNRATFRLFRRTVGDPSNFVSRLEAADNYSLGGHTTLSGSDLIYDGDVSTMERVATWRINADEADNTGRFHVYVVVKDWEEASGNLKMQVQLAFEDSAAGFSGPIQRIKVDSAHLGGAAYELWYLGTFDVPSSPEAPSVWYWRLYAQRLADTDNVHIKRLLIAPVDESPAVIEWDAAQNVTDDPDADFSMSTELRRAWWGTLTHFQVPASLEGRGLYLKPGTPNHIIIAASIDTNAALDHDPPSIGNPDGLTSVTIKYRPRYIWVSSAEAVSA